MFETPEAFAQRQLDAVDGLVDLMVARLTEQIPMVKELAPELRLEMVGWVRRIASAGLETVIKGEPLEELGPMIEEMARRRRDQGFDRSQTLLAYEVAQQALLDSLIGQLNGHPHEAALFPLVTRRLLEFQRITTLRVATAYMSPPEPQSRDRDASVQVLLEIRVGRRMAGDEDHDLGSRLGLSLPLKVVTVSVELGKRLAETVRNTRRLNPWGVVGVLDGRMVALTLRAPQAFAGPSGTTVLADDANPPAVEAAVTASGRAADVAAALGTTQLTAAQAAPLSAMLTLSHAERAAYIADCFGELPETARGQALLTAVSATLTYGRPGAAASALHVHRHTLDYRLGRFVEERGLDLNDPVTRFRCAIGLFLIGLMPHRAEERE